MEPSRYIDKAPLILAGFSFFGDPFAVSKDWTQENEIGRLWQRFIGYLTQQGEMLTITDPGVAYEIHLEDETTLATGDREVFIGVEVPQLEVVPLRLLVKYIPATTYAVFELKGQQIVSDWPHQIFQNWLPASEYEVAHPFTCQRYDHRFKGMDNIVESEIEVYVPVAKKQAGIEK